MKAVECSRKIGSTCSKRLVPSFVYPCTSFWLRRWTSNWIITLLLSKALFYRKTKYATYIIQLLDENIPGPLAKVYTKCLIEKMERFLNRMRLKAFHFLNPVTAAEKETFGLKTKNCLPVAEETKRLGEGIRFIPNIFLKLLKANFNKV